MQRIIMLATAGAMSLSSCEAFSAQDEIRSLPDKGTVTVSGTVGRVKNNHEFILRDNSGVIDVKMTTRESIVLKPGDNVTVNGTMENPWWGLMGKDIAASNVEVHKDLPTALSDAVTKTTGLSMNEAKPAQIGQLPENGLVKLTGTVEDTEGAKNFILKDDTGSINVSIQSDENAVLNKGVKVTVIGYVNDSMLGKKLSATKVIVTADASAGTAATNTQ